MISDREKMIQRHIGKYTDIILHILSSEDPKYKEINHYILLQHITERHYQYAGSNITHDEVTAKIKSAASILAALFLKQEKTFSNLHSSDMFELIEPILSRSLA